MTKRLPPDPEGRNHDRAAWAACAVQRFQRETGTDSADAVCDLLADLRHFCDREGFDFHHELERGQMHYEAETTQGETTVGNTNVLEDFKCPQCGSYGNFQIEVSTVIEFSDDGAEDDGADKEWQEDSYCACCECHYAAAVKDFRKPEQLNKSGVRTVESFIATIAALTQDGEKREGEAEPFVMENDDAVSTLNRLIEDAREIVKATV